MANSPAVSDKSLRMSYRIARGEQGVLTFEPYKSALLPHWKFKNPSIARDSSSTLYDKFLQYSEEGDFVGMDMCRKFVQMGMTRAKRYANHKGGRKYDKASGKELERRDHPGRKEKEESSKIFREVLEKCKKHEAYQRHKEEFLREQKQWDKEHTESAKGKEADVS
ncbi:MAG: hypothetical protein M1822_003421 [Bathelium mastoideum]|nr:MAG: hypothetical protein M1822_003421 [Bathelium mastoideum]